MNGRLIPAALGALLLAPSAVALSAQATCPDAAALTRGMSGPLADVRYLADDALEGREVGSPGAHCAAEYIAARFKAMGLRPGVDGSWFQSFPVRNGAAFGPDNALTIAGRTYASGNVWVPFGFSAQATVDAPAVYAGAGVSQPGAPDDQYAHLDVEGKVMVVEWGDPAASGSMRAEPHFKATLAAGRNAAALIVLLPDSMELPSPVAELRNALPIPVAAVVRSAAAAVRQAAENGTSIHIQTDVHPTTAEARNVVGVLPGADPALAGEYVIVGAHFDHLGWGGEGSLDPDKHEIHNGADDNASGTAAVMEIAERLATGAKPARTVIFVGFTGEEKGLWGSAHFVQSPPVELSKAVAMLNLDMVGRLRENALQIFGTGTAEEWEQVANAANAELAQPLKLAFSPDGYSPSDNATFTAAGIPAIFLFTNTHEDYHRPTDDWQKINAAGLDRVAEFATDITRELAGTPTAAPVALTPVHQEPPAPPSGNESARSSGYGPYFGSIPDMTPRDFGLRVTGVREGSPAEKAGLQSGDVVVEFDGKPIADIYAYTYALRDKKPGDVVKVVVERDGKRITLTAVLAVRR